LSRGQLFLGCCGRRLLIRTLLARFLCGFVRVLLVWK
jgi:hypothetical protein